MKTVHLILNVLECFSKYDFLNFYGDKLAFVASERSIAIYFHLSLGSKSMHPMIFNFSEKKTHYNINKCIASADLR